MGFMNFVYTINVNTTLHSNIDYTAQNQVLSDKIYQLEKSITDARQGIIRKSIFTETVQPIYK